MGWHVRTELDTDQLDGLVADVHACLRAAPEGPALEGLRALGLRKSVVLVLFLLRQNPVQEVVTEFFAISQATVSHRWHTLPSVVGRVLTRHVPHPAEASAGRVVLIDGTLMTTGDWKSDGTSMFSSRHRDTELVQPAHRLGDAPSANVQVEA
ncbi:hypothetical protein [Streptomyces sp. NPDC005533]|uniref:hypothetical protein n=1 Tax=Streptomyces sp. NPDC005533 TaxID=3364723 RepID=UPI0036CF6623